MTERDRREDRSPREVKEHRVNDPHTGAEERRRKYVRVDDDLYKRGGGRIERGSYGLSEAERGTSWLSVVFGWLAALGAGLILSGIVGAILGAEGPAASATESGVVGLVGLLITLLLASLIGGYVAGRLASRSGVKHGLLVALLSLVITIILAIVGALLGISLIGNLAGVTLPGLPDGAPQNLGTIFTVSVILALLFPCIGGAVGGVRGARTGR